MPDDWYEAMLERMRALVTGGETPAELPSQVVTGPATCG